ncbi:hypothetical protein EC988_000279 [Linderina pennispora]|nr:hypothetical protein EC988_000279 [Linderina pennispora]
MSEHIKALVARALAVGPENPQQTVGAAFAILNSKIKITVMAFSLAGSLAGAMVLFLIAVFFWRRSLVNRTSLRLIFFISLMDCVLGFVQVKDLVRGNNTGCRVFYFFNGFITYTSIYTSTCIAANLHIMFLRPKLKIPSKYLEILYFAVPVMAALIQFATLTGIAGSGGYCSAFEPYQPGTKSFTVFVVCAYLLLPGLCLLYNLVTVTRVVLLLLKKQGEISKTLSKISAESQALLSNGNDDGKGRAKMRHEEQRLKAARNVYNAAIRIALYPIAPLAWFCFNIAYYHIQYHLTMTFKSDISKFVTMQQMAWFSQATIVFANFVVFVSDPSVARVIREVAKALATRFPRLARRNDARVGPNQSIDSDSSHNQSVNAQTLHTMDTHESSYHLSFPEPSDEESAVYAHSTAVDSSSSTLLHRNSISQTDADSLLSRM